MHSPRRDSSPRRPVWSRERCPRMYEAALRYRAVKARQWERPARANQLPALPGFVPRGPCLTPLEPRQTQDRAAPTTPFASSRQGGQDHTPALLLNVAAVGQRGNSKSGRRQRKIAPGIVATRQVRSILVTGKPTAASIALSATTRM